MFGVVWPQRPRYISLLLALLQNLHGIRYPIHPYISMQIFANLTGGFVRLLIGIELQILLPYILYPVRTRFTINSYVFNFMQTNLHLVLCTLLGHPKNSIAIKHNFCKGLKSRVSEITVICAMLNSLSRDPWPICLQKG